jgi:uncharacterized protein (TIGR02147 family)
MHGVWSVMILNMDSGVERIDVFGFLDYRAFLRAFYLAGKERSGMSYRGFSKRAKLRSPNYLKLVIEGKRNLTRDMAKRFAHACRLEGKEAEYFCSLVDFGQAATVEERNFYYGQLQNYKRYNIYHELDLAQDYYHSQWFLPAIREMVATRHFREDYSWIAKRMLPRIKENQAQIAVQTLLKLGLLKRDQKGKIVQGAPMVTTGAETHSLHLANYHRTMMGHAATSIDRLKPSQRDISSVTLCLASDGVTRLKKLISDFRRKLLDLEEAESNREQVIQVNFQVFPMTSVDEKEK